jgi:hypothetical protein
MPALTIGIGGILTALGFMSYIGSSGASWTALIPAMVGVPLILLGLVARNEKARKHAMHAAVGLAMIGFLGTIRVLPQMLTLIGGGYVERPGAIIAQITMACCSFVLVLFGVRSFVVARRKAKE